MSDVFAQDYLAARDSFCRLAGRLQCRLQRVPINEKGPTGEVLSIDIARLGADQPRRAVVISSGLHGVEGFFGSAVQQAWLETQTQRQTAPGDCAVVLLHALNPYGFAWVRRSNECNVDLNRNFLLPEEDYAGAPPGYARLDRFLNPRHPPRRFDPFQIGAGLMILRYGLAALKESVAVGQYEFPHGLFFGGHFPSQTTGIVQAEFLNWVGPAEEIVHIDLHSGLGKFATCQLLTVEAPQSPAFAWLKQNFGDAVKNLAGSVAFKARGPMAAWLTHTITERRYIAIAPEFGTLPVTRVLAALRAENQAHFFAEPEDAITKLAKKRLFNAFCPENAFWRNVVLADGIRIIEQALHASPVGAVR